MRTRGKTQTEGYPCVNPCRTGEQAHAEEREPRSARARAREQERYETALTVTVMLPKPGWER